LRGVSQSKDQQIAIWLGNGDGRPWLSSRPSRSFLVPLRRCGLQVA
jgi:hypothetical protein